MLTHDGLLESHRELANAPVLSVYVDGNQHDPAERSTWRLQLEHGLAEARRSLAAAGPEEIASFDAAARWVEHELKGFDAFLPDKAFVAFATADRLAYGETVSVRMPNLVRWARGIAVTPYVRGLKQERPVVVTLLDSQRARVFLYQDGAVRETDDLRADTFVGDLTDSGASNRGAVVTGQRGETSTDAGRRYLQVAAERLVKELARVVAQRAGDHGFVVVGGTAEMETWLRDALPRGLDGRVSIEPSLQVEMTESEVREAVGASASEFTRRWQMELVQLLFDQARAGLRATMVDRDTERAIEELRVDSLLLSRTRTRTDPVDADCMIGMAFAGRAHVEEVAGAAGELLDREWEGIASRLRFRIPDPARPARAEARAGTDR